VSTYQYKQTGAKKILSLQKNIYLCYVDNQPCSIPIKGLALLFLLPRTKRDYFLGGVKRTVLTQHFSKDIFPCVEMEQWQHSAL
jgi:hypothetical protein